MESEGDEASHQHTKRSKLTMQYSSVIIPTLPPELITEILSRLPVKSLMQFTSVSKSWLALISSPEFIKDHLSISANMLKDCTHHRLIFRVDQHYNYLKDCSLNSLLYESVTEASDLDYPMKNAYEPVYIVGSVNGLICLTIRAKDLVLWNPAIKKYKKLPVFRRRMNHSSAAYGFGYDEFHDDYKVVGVFYYYQRRSLLKKEVKVYSLKSDSWRSLDDSKDGVRISGYSARYLNGKLHWATFCGLGKYSGWGPWAIISFDMADEKWGKVEQPCLGEEDFGFKLDVLGNNLSVLCTCRISCISNKSINVWVMKEYGVKESWTKMYNIKCPNDTYSIFPSCYLSNKGEILLIYGSASMTHNQEAIPMVIKKIYNPNDDSIRYAEVTNFGGCPVTETYIESLVCPLAQKD